jgi:methionyl-tRNA synthetase
VLAGEYTKSVGTWAPPSLPVGQKLRTPEPLFKKLDPGVVVAEELRRMEEREGK